jgi:predicted ester cyclase
VKTRTSSATGLPSSGARPAISASSTIWQRRICCSITRSTNRAAASRTSRPSSAGFREAFPDLNFWAAADLIAEGDYVVGRWEGGGTHTGPAFSDFLIGSLPAATGRKLHFTGTTVLRVENGKITEEIGLDDGVTALQQLGLLRAA